MCSTTSELSRSAELKTFHVSRVISSPPVVRPRGRCVETVRPPSTTEPVVVPCRARPARRPPSWRASTRPDPPTRRSSSGPSPPTRSPTRTPTRRLSPRRPPRPAPPSPPATARRPGPPTPPARRSQLRPSSSPWSLSYGCLVVPDPYQLAGLRRGTTASLQQPRGHRPQMGVRIPLPPPRCTAGDRSDPRVWRWSVRRMPPGPCRGTERGAAGRVRAGRV